MMFLVHTTVACAPECEVIMTIQEMYAAIDSNYEKVLSRLMKDTLIIRLVKKYLDDTNYEKLSENIGKKNYEDAFTAAHTLKGITSNLGFDKLAESSSAITEALRASEYGQLDEMLAKVKADHEEVVASIKALD